MLKRLYIENFALIEKLEIEFDDGMSVLTGETGAGKSIIIGALSRLLGEKAGKDDIRTGTDMAIIEGDFSVNGNKAVQSALKCNEIEFENDIVTIRKEIPKSRSSRSLINSSVVNLSVVKEIGLNLAELFGQHSHQKLLDENNHLLFLDQFAKLDSRREKIAELYVNWQKAKHDLRRLNDQKESARKERELMIYQRDEIEKAGIVIGEEEKLNQERKILSASLILGEKSSSLLEILDRDEYSAMNALNGALSELIEMIRHDKTLEKQADLLNSAVVNLEEFRSEIEKYQANIPNDPERLEEINYRLDELYKLKNKYGGSEQAALEYLERLKFELESKLDIDQQIKNLIKEETAYKTKYTKLALDLNTDRATASNKLSKLVITELKKLGIESAKFEFDFVYENDPDGIKLGDQIVKPFPHGIDNGAFLISANPGEPLKNLVKTASGGELSRVMLALKSANKTGNKKIKPLLVFDEIDSGIGGKTALKVARRIAELATDYQLLVVTHLHQIASAGKNHYSVTKAKSALMKNRNVVSVNRLTGDDKTLEIERMISIPEKVG